MQNSNISLINRQGFLKYILILLLFVFIYTKKNSLIRFFLSYLYMYVSTILKMFYILQKNCF